MSNKGGLWSVSERASNWIHDITCGGRRVATSKAIAMDPIVRKFVLQHASMNSVCVNAMASSCLEAGFSFSPLKGLKSRDVVAERKRRIVNHALNQIFERDASGIANMLANLRGYCEEFSKMESNGIAHLSTSLDGTKFQDVFVLYDASTKIAQHASMRVVSIDACHLRYQRKDLRVILLEGITSNNTIFPIAFLVCFNENKETLKKFFDSIKKFALVFWMWLDNSRTTIIGDRGPGCCLKGVVECSFETHVDEILRSCVKHAIGAIDRNFKNYDKSLVWALGRCDTIAEATLCLHDIQIAHKELHDYIVQKSDFTFWVLAYAPNNKTDYFKVTSNMAEQEFSRWNRNYIREKGGQYDFLSLTMTDF